MGKILFVIGIIVIMMLIPAPGKSGRGTCRPRSSGGLPWMGNRKRQRNERKDTNPFGDDTDKYDDMPLPERQGDSEIEKVVAAHADCTAEVLKVAVTGRNAVDNAKWLIKPGDPVTLKKYKNWFKAFGHNYSSLFYLGSLYPDASSNIPRLFSEDIPYEAYLGGRDTYDNSKTCIFISIIVFYRIPGVQPTKVNLHF